MIFIVVTRACTQGVNVDKNLSGEKQALGMHDRKKKQQLLDGFFLLTEMVIRTEYEDVVSEESASSFPLRESITHDCKSHIVVSPIHTWFFHLNRTAIS